MSIWINVIENPTRVWLCEFMWPLIQLELPYNDAYLKSYSMVEIGGWDNQFVSASPYLLKTHFIFVQYLLLI